MSSEPSELDTSEFFSSDNGNTKSSTGFNETVSLPNQGGMSIVQKTKILGKWHLIKRLKPEYSKHPVHITNFEKEFDIAYHLDHPHIVRYLNKGHDKEGFYIIMEYVDGQSLRTILDQSGNIKNINRIEKICLQLLDALSYLHKQQIYHLDLKPENIMLTNKGDNIKLLDFGLSCTDSHLPIDSGTLKYASPEQILNAEMVDGRSDLYSLGILLLEAIQGSADKKNIFQIKGVLKKVIAKCVKEIPVDRFQSAEEIIEFIHANKKRNNIIQYSIVIVLLGFTVLFYSIIHSNKKDTAVDIVNNESSKKETIIENKNLNDAVLNTKETPKEAKRVLATYYDSIISMNDSLKCIQLGEKLFADFKMKAEKIEKKALLRSRKLVLMDIQDTCTKENQKQWREFSSVFSLGSAKYDKAERIYSKAEKESSAKIWKMMFPNGK